MSTEEVLECGRGGRDRVELTRWPIVNIPLQLTCKIISQSLMQMMSSHSWFSSSFAITPLLSWRSLTRRGIHSRFLEDIIDSDIRQSFRSKLEIIQSKCINKAKQSLEMCLKLPEHWNKVWGNIKEDLCRFGIYAVLRDPYSKVVGNEGGEGLHKFGIDRVDSNHHFFCDWHQDWILFTPAFDLKICFELFHITFSFASLLK